jgi:hypothetical protein
MVWSLTYVFHSSSVRSKSVFIFIVKMMHRCADINPVSTKYLGTGFEDKNVGIVVGRDDG